MHHTKVGQREIDPMLDEHFASSFRSLNVIWVGHVVSRRTVPEHEFISVYAKSAGER
jgi:hypothetical protein